MDKNKIVKIIVVLILLLIAIWDWQVSAGIVIIYFIARFFIKRNKRKTAAAQQELDVLKSISPEKIVVVDTETTGLKRGYDEIVSVAITDGNGNELFYSLVKPERRRSWKAASEINNIWPADVKGKPHLKDLKETIEPLFENAHLLVGYNLSFDLPFLKDAGIKVYDSNTFDVMKEFAPVNGEWNEYFKDYKWAKLSECASRYKYKFHAHDALEDAKATAYCFQSLIRDPKYLNVLKSRY